LAYLGVENGSLFGGFRAGGARNLVVANID
jgi:hypothetical protein